jgi:hypothetical protein
LDLRRTARALRRRGTLPHTRSAATRHRDMRPDQRPRLLFQANLLLFRAFRGGWRELYGQPFEHRLAPIVDAGRARLRAVGERLKQIGQLGVAMLFHEPRHIVGPATAARLADDRQRGVTKVGQDDRAVAGHGGTSSRTPGSSTSAGCGSSGSDRGWRRASKRSPPGPARRPWRYDCAGSNAISLAGFDVKRQ